MFVNKLLFSRDDLISGEKFVKICDKVYNHYDYIDKTRGSLKQRLLYTDTWQLEEFIQLLPTKGRYVLVTHNSDINIYDSTIDKIPHNIVFFSQNKCTNSKRVNALPIGLENDRWFPEVCKKEKILQKNASEIKPENLVYINHAIWTNPDARKPVYDHFIDKTWATCVENCQNGINFDDYINAIEQHFFIVSPPGNGIDCHRTWEALYCNRVPIVIRNCNTDVYDDLPVLIVDSWQEITEDFLRSKMKYFIETEFNFEKLKFQYWETMIRNSAKNSV